MRYVFWMLSDAAKADNPHYRQELKQNSRDQRAVFFASRSAGRPCLPLDHARSASQTARSSRASIRNVPQERRASVCGSAAGVALRLRSARRFSPLSAPLSSLSDRRPKPEYAQLQLRFKFSCHCHKN